MVGRGRSRLVTRRTEIVVVTDEALVSTTAEIALQKEAKALASVHSWVQPDDNLINSLRS